MIRKKVKKTIVILRNLWIAPVENQYCAPCRRVLRTNSFWMGGGWLPFTNTWILKTDPPANFSPRKRHPAWFSSAPNVLSGFPEIVRVA